MSLPIIPFQELMIHPGELWNNKWLLLTAGDFSKKHFNSMTVGWGSFGVMWNKPLAMVVVRPTRFTYHFIEQYESFTLCAFPGTYRKALKILGTKSGRDGDKIAEAGLQPIASTKISAPAFAEAELIIECRKMYWHDFDPSHFLDASIQINYPLLDYHRVYFGEIMVVMGGDGYH